MFRDTPGLALLIYASYSGVSFLPIRSPKPDETIDAYLAYIDTTDGCGDTLFLFLLSEIGDASSWEEALDNLCSAADDLNDMTRKLIPALIAHEGRTKANGRKRKAKTARAGKRA